MARRSAGPRKPGRPPTVGQRREASGAPRERSLPRPLWWLLGAAVLVPPLFILPTADDMFRLPKLMAAESLGLASLLGLALAGRLRDLVDPALWIRHRRVVWVVLPILAVATASLAWTGHPAATRRGLADLWIGAACLVGWCVGLRRVESRALLAALAVPAALAALLATLQFHEIWRPLGVVQGRHSERTQVVSLAGNPADLAGFLLLPALLLQARLAPRVAAAQPRGARRRLERREAVSLGALILVLYGLFVTQTLSALTALAGASAVLWTLTLPRRRRIPALLVAAALAAGLALAVPDLRSRLGEKWQLLTAGKVNEVMTNRFDGWRAAVWMLARSPLLGQGFATYRMNFAPAKLALIERGERFDQTVRPHFANAHNDLLEVGAELGALGLAALAVALVAVGGAARSLPLGERALAAAGLTGVVILAMAQFPFEVAITAYPTLLFLAWILRAGEPEGASEAAA